MSFLYITLSLSLVGIALAAHERTSNSIRNVKRRRTLPLSQQLTQLEQRVKVLEKGFAKLESLEIQFENLKEALEHLKAPQYAEFNHNGELYTQN